MSESIKTLILRMAFSKNSWKQKAKYIFLGIVFFPFLQADEIRKGAKDSSTAEASAAGDDIYPLF